MKMYYKTPSVNKNSDEKKGFIEVKGIKLDYIVADEKPEEYFDSIDEALNNEVADEKPEAKKIKKKNNVLH